ncbi:hypothetical protein [Micromonospora sp. NBC_00421]|uniref:hypothetical protein n=1 Tax=Micromonospora sp. NBC_00421 TaxID=2975976 RepID=UPI002E23A170
MTDLRCWQCGVKPTETAELCTPEAAEPIAVLATEWPPGDHPHAVTPPTPDQLTAAGHTTYRRIMEAS